MVDEKMMKRIVNVENIHVGADHKNQKIQV